MKKLDVFKICIEHILPIRNILPVIRNLVIVCQMYLSPYLRGCDQLQNVKFNLACSMTETR